MEIEERVKNILSDLSGEKDIQNNARLQDDLSLDSLSLVTLLIEIEDEFSIELDEKDMNPFDLNNAEDVIKLAERYVGDKNEQAS